MPIPEAQLETWSHQGSITQSSDTYNSVKLSLTASGSHYSVNDCEVFLQGSYGNDTNIFSESDVDIVIKLNSCFHHDLTQLTADQQAHFKSCHSDATYTHVNFKDDVLKVLRDRYGSAIDAGEKAIAIAANGNRRKADVIAAIQFRRFVKFLSTSDQSYEDGICFYTRSGAQIVNYPKQHSGNLTRKHQATSRWLKPLVRIFKNMRSKLIDEGMLVAGMAPSYYLEGLLYNVPNDKFGGNYQQTFADVINWIRNSDRSKFVCANEQYYLFHAYSPVTWRSEQCDTFLTSAVTLWEQW